MVGSLGVGVVVDVDVYIIGLLFRGGMLWKVVVWVGGSLGREVSGH